MSHLPEHGAIESTLAALDRLAGSTDASTAQTLDTARNQALAGARAPRPVSRWWAGAAAAALALALVVVLVDGNGTDRNRLSRQLVADPELYEDMEFYLWLAKELDTQ